MQNQTSQNNQPVITSDQPFIVKIKLLTNEVYEINTSPNISVAEFKKLVLAKTQVPVDRQRLVYSGKQLLDNTLISEYVKESGMTVHLIARAPPQPENTQTNTNTQPSQQPQPQQQQQQQQQRQVPPQSGPQQVPPFPFTNPLSIFNMFSGNVPNGPNQQSQPPNPNLFAQNIGNAVNNLMGNIGIRVVTTPPFNTPNQQQQQNNVPPPPPPPPSVQQSQRVQPWPQQVPNNPRPQMNPPSPYNNLEQLQQSINRVNLPEQNPNSSNSRQFAINYLRRLQNNILRFVPQLNRGIQLLQEGRTNHLNQFIPIFQSFNRSNHQAVQLIRNLNSQPNNQHHLQCNDPTHNHHHSHHHHPHNHQQNQPNQQNSQSNQQNQNTSQQPIINQASQQPTNNSPINTNGQGVNATIIIAQENEGNTGGISLELNSGQGGQNIMNALNSFLQPGTGSPFNFANLFAPPRNQSNQQNQTRPQQPSNNVPETTLQSNQQIQSQPVQQQSTQPSIQTQLSSSQNQPQQNQSLPQTQPPNPQVPNAGQENPLNMLAGTNIMSMFNNLQQSGGMGALLNMSLGQMIEEDHPATVYSAILKSVNGTQLLACFTQKDFSFIGRKREQLREGVLRAISIAGSHEDLVNKYAQDFENILIPEGSVKNEQVCRKRVGKILHKNIQKILGYLLDNTTVQLNLTDLVLSYLKSMYCESIEEISKHTENLESTFSNIKRGVIQSLDQVIPGFSGLFYSIIEKDLLRIYREYVQQKERKQSLSEQQAKDEADLLRKIEEGGKEDGEEMANYEHSKFYPKSAKQ